MKSETSVQTKKPIPVLKKSLKLDLKEFSKAVAKTASHAAMAQWDSLGEDAVEILGTLGLRTGPSEVAWLLVYRALNRALSELINEEVDNFEHRRNFGTLILSLNTTLQNQSITINKKFFDNPDRDPIFHAIAPIFSRWLIDQDVDPPAASVIAGRLPTYFAMALHSEWASSPADYSVLREQINTPFTQANERLQRWALYSASLIKQIDEPMFNESFSLKHVFVPPRAYFLRKNEQLSAQESGGQVERSAANRMVVDLQKALEDWLQKGDPEDAIRLISGGPGSGKSSFAKMFAAYLARRTDLDILFIPLHHFEPKGEMIEAVGKFVQADGILLGNPLGAEYREKRLVLVFDGLDELAMQGQVAERTAQDFVREVQRKVERLNQHKIWIQVVISGRELVMQQSESDFRGEGQILHLLPYFVAASELENYQDKGKLLKVDQRHIWWKNYGMATGLAYDGLPSELDQAHLAEITAQPLLNYLVALSLKRGKLKFSEETNLNAVYADLLKAIYERGWSKHQHAAIQGMEESDFCRILEEIALATWHGDGRKTTVRDINSHCENSGLRDLLNRFQIGLQEDSRTKVTQLLTAFYFRQSGQDTTGEKTFEFTHKSFGEYLVARRVIREMKLIHKQLIARALDPDLGWDERESLRRWTLLCGMTRIDEYLCKFILDEIALIYEEDSALVGEFQDAFARLFAFMMKRGMPMERQTPRVDFKEEYRRANNSEEALMICINACARNTRVLTLIKWPSREAFGEWLARVRGQPAGWSHVVLLDCLSYLDLSRCNLKSQFLWNANPEGSSLSGASMVGSDLRYANVRNAEFQNTILAYASVGGVDFKGGQLSGVNFDGATLITHQTFGRAGSKIIGPAFNEADLSDADFTGCDLRNADFSGAILVDASFKFTNLTGANFSSCDISGADFTGALLARTIFDDSVGDAKFTETVADGGSDLSSA